MGVTRCTKMAFFLRDDYPIASTPPCTAPAASCGNRYLARPWGLEPPAPGIMQGTVTTCWPWPPPLPESCLVVSVKPAARRRCWNPRPAWLRSHTLLPAGVSPTNAPAKTRLAAEMEGCRGLAPQANHLASCLTTCQRRLPFDHSFQFTAWGRTRPHTLSQVAILRDSVLTYHHHRCQGSCWHWCDSTTTTTTAGQPRPGALLPGTGEIPLTGSAEGVEQTWRAPKTTEVPLSSLPSSQRSSHDERGSGKRGMPNPAEA